MRAQGVAVLMVIACGGSHDEGQDEMQVGSDRGSQVGGQLGRWRPVLWKRFADEAGAFSMLLPGEPHKDVKTRDGKIGQVTTYSFNAEANESSYSVGYSDWPDTVDMMAAEMLDAVGDGIAKKLHGKLVSATARSLGEYPGREFVVAVDAKPPFVITGRMFVVKARVYELEAHNRGATPSAIALRTLDSFRLEPR